MPRRHHATVLLALTALLGPQMPAAAQSRPQAAVVHPVAPVQMLVRARSVSPAPLQPAVVEPAEPVDPWVERVETRLATIEHVAQQRSDAEPSAPSEESALERELATIASAGPRSASVGIAVHELGTGNPVFTWHEREALNPASNQKLLTAAAALELLGADYRFQTRVLRSGDALVIVGEGDPSLQTGHLRAMAEQIAERTDLSKIRRIVVDDSAFSERRFGPGYDSEGPGPSYMAPSGALSLQWNTIEIGIRGAAKGQPVEVWVSPPSAHVTVQSSATGGRGTISTQTRADGERTVIDVRGNLPAGSSTKTRRRITDPGRFTGTTFANLLRHHGAAALRIERGIAPDDAETLVTHESEALPEVLRTSLSYSNNFASEQLLRTLGWRMTGEPGDWTNGRLAVRRYWDAAGLPLRDLLFENASGLSSWGRLTAGSLARLLAFATREGSEASVLPDVLPAAGKEGTMRGRLGRAKGRVNAKTGTMNGASALSGVVQTRGGERLGFSILVAGPISAHRSRRLQDRVVMALVEHDGAA